LSLPCIAVVPATPCHRGWLPCTLPRAPGKLLCTTHHDMCVGIILGFQNRLKLPDHPFVDPRILKRVYAKLKKTKHRRTRRAHCERTIPKRDSRGTACRARMRGKHRSALERSVKSQPNKDDAHTQAVSLEEPLAQTQTAEGAIATRD
jgi:hypothetical protein